MKRLNPFLISLIFVLLMDLITKEMVIKGIQVGQGIPVIEGYVDIVHVRNRGVAFGLFAHGPISRAIPYVNVLILIGFGLYLLRMKPSNYREPLCAGLILGGAVGNLIDRIRFGEVVDFLDLHIGGYHWPAFNVADAAVSLGAILLGLSFLSKGAKKGP